MAHRRNSRCETMARLRTHAWHGFSVLPSILQIQFGFCGASGKVGALVYREVQQSRASETFGDAEQQLRPKWRHYWWQPALRKVSHKASQVSLGLHATNPHVKYEKKKKKVRAKNRAVALSNIPPHFREQLTKHGGRYSTQRKPCITGILKKHRANI